MATINDPINVQTSPYDPEGPEYDLEKQKSVNDRYEFCETTPTYVRHDFIKKVFGIVLMQLLFSFSVMLTFYNIKPIRAFFVRYTYITHISFVCMIISMLVLGCFPDFARNKKVCVTSLCVVTPIFTIVLTGYSCLFEFYEIGIAIGLTTLMSVLLIGFSFQTKLDFTRWLVPVIIVSFNIFIIAMLMVFMKHRIKKLILAGIGTLVGSIWIIIDVQMVIGGNHKYSFTIDDYAYASLCIYTDIVTLFMDILRFVRF